MGIPARAGQCHGPGFVITTERDEYFPGFVITAERDEYFLGFDITAERDEYNSDWEAEQFR